MGAATTASRPQGQAPRATMNGTNGTLNGLPTNGLSKAQKTSSPIRKSPATNAVKSPVSAPSAYSIMAERIANRVAEMAESITFVERQKPGAPQQDEQERKKPRKLEMRLPGGPASDNVSFSPAFLDNTLQRMLGLQQDMLKMTASLSRTEGVDEKAVKDQAAQSAELSRIIAMICAEKARQGA